MCAAGVLWGTGGLVMELLARRSALGTTTVSAWRMGIAAVAVLSVVLVRRRGHEVLDGLRRYPLSSVLVGIGVGGYQALYFGAVVAVGVSISTVISLGIAPVLLTGWEHARARTRPTRAEALVLTLALSGLVSVGRAPADGDRPTLGIALALASGATYAATTMVGKRMSTGTTALSVTTWTTVFGTVLLVPIAALAGGPYTSGKPSVVALLAYLGVATLALAYALLYTGLRTVRASTATIASLLEPVTAAVVAALLLDERIGPLGIAGTALILLAVATLSRNG